MGDMSYQVPRNLSDDEWRIYFAGKNRLEGEFVKATLEEYYPEAKLNQKGFDKILARFQKGMSYPSEEEHDVLMDVCSNYFAANSKEAK